MKQLTEPLAPATIHQKLMAKPIISERRSFLSSSSSSLVSVEESLAVIRQNAIQKLPSSSNTSSSKLNLNSLDPEIIDIDFDVYNNNVIEKQIIEIIEFTKDNST